MNNEKTKVFSSQEDLDRDDSLEKKEEEDNAGFIIYCMVCRSRVNLPPPKPFSLIQLRHQRTKIICSSCGWSPGYWEEMESRKHSSPTGERRLCIYLKIPKKEWKEQIKTWQAKLAANWRPDS